MPEGPRWGLFDVGVAMLVGWTGSFLAVAAVAGIGGWRSTTEFPGWGVFIGQLPLWAAMIVIPVVATRSKGAGPVADLGLRFTWWDVPLGLAVGALTQLALLPLLYLPLRRWVSVEDLERPARELVERFGGTGGRVLFVLMVCVCAPVAEEILYRGLLLRSLSRRFGAALGVAVTAVVFGLVHFQAVQTLGLVAFGAVAGILAVWTGRLGPAVAAHMGFNAVTALTLLHR